MSIGRDGFVKPAWTNLTALSYRVRSLRCVRYRARFHPAMSDDLVMQNLSMLTLLFVGAGLHFSTLRVSDYC